MSGKRAREVAWFVLVPLLAVVTALATTRPPFPFAAAERLTEAAAFQVLGPQPPLNPDIVVIGITEETLSAFPYRSPVDRAFLTSLIRTLKADGVRAIGLDVVLDQPTEPEKDAALRAELHRSDTPVVAITVAPATSMAPAQRRFLSGFLDGVLTGDANLVRDRFDDTIRTHVPRNAMTGALSFPAAIAAAVGVGVPEQPFPVEWRRPTAGQPAGREVTTYLAQSVGLLPASWLKGKIALIGSLVVGSDEHRTPASLFGPPSFGVDIHARVLSQILDGRTDRTTFMRSVEIAAVSVLAVAGVVIGSIWSGTAIVITGLVFVVGSLVAYACIGFPVPLVPPIVALAISGGGTRAWRGWADRRDRRALRALFSRFVSAPVVDQIMKDRDLFMAGGRPRPQELTATVLYADVAGFTGICERLAPEPLIAWLDAYLEAMTSLIIAHQGVVLRFIGDGILAVFGVPIPRRDDVEIAQDACNAARCAVAMEEAMRRMNDNWAAEGLPVGGLRIGLHTGSLVAGSLGRGERMEFCLLGDTANVGARLEQLGKLYAEPDPGYCTIVVGEPTRLLLGKAFPAVPIGNLPLRGRRATLRAYRIDSAAIKGIKVPLPIYPATLPDP